MGVTRSVMVVAVMSLAMLAAGCGATTSLGADTTTSRPLTSPYQPIPGLECIRWKGSSPYPPLDPNVSARCLYEEWRTHTNHPDVWVTDDATIASLFAQPFRPMRFAGCGPYIGPDSGGDRFPNGGQVCTFHGDGGDLTLDAQHVSSGPVLVNPHFTGQ